MRLPLTEPQSLTAAHDVADFYCGEPDLDDWLARRALVNQLGGASRSFVVTDADKRVCGYYALAAGSISHALATGKVKRNMPDPVPAIVLGRLAVAKHAQGVGLGGDLLMDAVRRVEGIAQHAGVRVLLVHAINESAKRFYLRHGFLESPQHPMALMLAMPRTL